VKNFLRKIMKRKIIFVLMFCFLFLEITKSQPNDTYNGVYFRKHFSERKAISYPKLREADITWSKMVWRKVDLREKMNLQYYYPEQPMDGRMSFIDLIIKAIRSGNVNAYDEKDFLSSQEFGLEMTLDEISQRFGVENGVKRNYSDDGEGYSDIPLATGDLQTFEVKSLIIKEVWYFDKQRSSLGVQIIGMCPIREYGRGLKKVFWIYFPEFRNALATQDVFNTGNDSERRSFDDLFVKRNFSSYIIQESNLFNNRVVEDYSTGIEILQEADRIMQNIFILEQDLWEY